MHYQGVIDRPLAAVQPVFADLISRPGAPRWASAGMDVAQKIGVTFESNNPSPNEFRVTARTRSGAELSPVKVFRLSPTNHGSATLVDVEVQLETVLRATRVNSVVVSRLAQAFDHSRVINQLTMVSGNRWIRHCERYVDQSSGKRLD